MKIGRVLDLNSHHGQGVPPTPHLNLWTIRVSILWLWRIWMWNKEAAIVVVVAVIVFVVVVAAAVIDFSEENGAKNGIVKIGRLARSDFGVFCRRSASPRLNVDLTTSSNASVFNVGQFRLGQIVTTLKTWFFKLFTYHPARGQHSSEVALALLIQQPLVRFSAFPKLLEIKSMALSVWKLE